MSEQEDVKRLRALAKNMAAEGETYHIPGAKEDAAAIVSVLARLEALEADARRYQYLRKNRSFDIIDFFDESWTLDKWVNDEERHKEMDWHIDNQISIQAAIDAARGKR